MAQCRPLKMPPAAKAVLLSLADLANERDECWPSLPKLAEWTCFSERTVQSAIQWLESAKLVSADRSSGRRTRYVVAPGAFQPPQPLPEPTQLAQENSGLDTPAAIAVTDATTAGVPPQPLPSTHKAKAKSKIKSKSSATFVAPDWVPPDLWTAFLDMRKRKRQPPTDFACRLIVAELEKMRRAGQDWQEALKTSIRNSWTDVYPPKPKGPDHATHRESAADRVARINAEATFDDDDFALT